MYTKWRCYILWYVIFVFFLHSYCRSLYILFLKNLVAVHWGRQTALWVRQKSASKHLHMLLQGKVLVKDGGEGRAKQDWRVCTCIVSLNCWSLWEEQGAEIELSLRSNVKTDSARDLEGTVTQEKLKSCWIRTKSEVNNLPVNTNLNSELKGALFKSFYFCAITIFAGLRSSLFLFVI